MPQAVIAPEETTKITKSTEDEWQLDTVKACLINDPECEACQ
ncbi:MAG: hypothetical protein WCO52_01780 [bacterium]